MFLLLDVYRLDHKEILLISEVNIKILSLHYDQNTSGDLLSNTVIQCQFFPEISLTYPLQPSLYSSLIINHQGSTSTKSIWLQDDILFLLVFRLHSYHRICPENEAFVRHQINMLVSVWIVYVSSKSHLTRSLVHWSFSYWYFSFNLTKGCVLWIRNLWQWSDQVV